MSRTLKHILLAALLLVMCRPAWADDVENPPSPVYRQADGSGTRHSPSEVWVDHTYSAASGGHVIINTSGGTGDLTDIIAGFGIDVQNAGGPSPTIDFDPTEILTPTWGAGAASYLWTWDTTGTDVTATFSSGLVTWVGTLVADGFTLAVNKVLTMGTATLQQLSGDTDTHLTDDLILTDTGSIHLDMLDFDTNVGYSFNEDSAEGAYEFSFNPRNSDGTKATTYRNGGVPVWAADSSFNLCAPSGLIIPVNPATAISKPGGIAVTTHAKTGPQIQFVDPTGTRRTLPATRSISVRVESLVAADDNFYFWTAPWACTVTQVSVTYTGTGTTTAQIALINSNGTSMTHNTPVANTATASSGVTGYVAVTANNTMLQGEKLGFNVTNTPAPTTDNYVISVTVVPTATN